MSLTDHPTTTKIFSIIGIIGTIIAALLGGFQLYKLIVDEPEIKVECIPSPIYLPQLPDENKSIKNVSRLLANKMDLVADFSIPRDDSQIKKIAELSRTVKAYEDKIADLYKITSLWHYSIKNTGSNEVKNIAFLNDFDGYYYLKIVGEDAVYGDCKNKILISSLGPSSEANLIIWAYNQSHSRLENPELFLANEVKVTFPSGIAKIDYAKTVTGWGKYTIHFCIGLAILLGIILFAGSLHIVLLKDEIKALGQKLKTKADTLEITGK